MKLAIPAAVLLVPGLLAMTSRAQPLDSPPLTDDPLAPAADAVDRLRQRTRERANLDFNLGYTMIWQVADGADAVDQTNSLLTGSYDFDGYWEAIPEDHGLGRGGVGWLVEGGHNIGHHRSEDFSANLGSGLGLNDDADPTTDIAITELWWQHTLGPAVNRRPRDVGKELTPEQLAALAEEEIRLITLTAGKIDQTVFFDANRVANDETSQFLSTPLVNSVAVAFPDNGVGLNVWVQPREWFYVTAGFGDANAVASQGPSDFDASELFWAAELGFTPEIEGLGPGHYRFMVWTTELDNGAGGTDDGAGFSLSFDQQVLPGVIPFLRYSHGDDDVLDFEHMISAGVGFENLLQDQDLLGVGYVHAEPTDAALDDESILEIFYRVRLTDTLDITPAVQAVFDPVANPNEDTVIVGAIRAQFTF